MDFRKSIASISIDRLLVILALCASVTAIGLWAWKRQSGEVDPQYLSQKYGISDAVEQQIPTPDGTMDATIVPVTLTNGEHAQLIIPRNKADYPLYLRDSNGGMIPVSLGNSSMSRDEFVRSGPVVYEGPPPQYQPQYQTRTRRKRSLEKEALIVAGSAGAGSAIGAAAGGGKGAAVGALSGGIAGLVYDLATRNR